MPPNEGKAALAAWRRIEAEAHAELSSGHQAALAVERESKPWERARFLAILEAFVDEWQPRGGIELALIDQMAQAHASYLVWMERLRMQSASEGRAEAYNLKRDGCWQPSRVDKAGGWTRRHRWPIVSTRSSCGHSEGFATCAATPRRWWCKMRGR